MYMHKLINTIKLAHFVMEIHLSTLVLIRHMYSQKIGFNQRNLAVPERLLMYVLCHDLISADLNLDQ